jgi:beta-galactosidase
MLSSPTAMFRIQRRRRDRAPLIETEDFRDEGARRFWDDFSPPYFGFKKGPNDTWQLHLRELRPGRRSSAIGQYLG